MDTGVAHARRCATTGAVWSMTWRRSSMVLDVLVIMQRRVLRRRMCLWGPVHRHTARADPRHQGGEGVAGTPGACSQAFCHPIRCMRCAFVSTETCSLHTGPHHNHHNHHNHHKSSFARGSPFSVRATSCLDTSSWRHGCRLRWDLLREEEEGATTPLVVATRADVRRSCTGGSPPPLFAEGGG